MNESISVYSRDRPQQTMRSVPVREEEEMDGMQKTEPGVNGDILDLTDGPARIHPAGVALDPARPAEHPVEPRPKQKRGLLVAVAAVATLAVVSTIWLFFARADLSRRLAESQAELSSTQALVRTTEAEARDLSDQVTELTGRSGDLKERADETAESNRELAAALKGCQRGIDIIGSNPKPTPATIRAVEEAFRACYRVEPERVIAV